ncbi:MAG: response regulator [Desulfarculus sp.]|nr:response regulator [Desulfarculus sp.]
MPIRVLIVDDSASMRAVVKKTLSAAGYAVETCLEAQNGAEALEILHREPVDVVLSDLHMPEMDGLELLRTLQKEGKVPPCFILVTTEGRKERLKEALGLGARGYVSKPFHPEGLRKILSLLVGEPDGEQLEQGPEGLDF